MPAYDAFTPLTKRQTKLTVKLSTVDTPNLDTLADECNRGSYEGEYLTEFLQHILKFSEVDSVTLRQTRTLQINRIKSGDCKMVRRSKTDWENLPTNQTPENY